MRPRSPRLPIAVPPAHHETITSYVARLSAVHGVPYDELWLHLSATSPNPHNRRRFIVLDRLTAATGHPISLLERALPELRDPAPDWRQLRHLPQRACPRCAARHRGGTVMRLFAHHEFLCTRHGYWIGPVEPTDPNHRPRYLTDVAPELVAAQHRHNQLVRQHGWQTVFDALDASTSVCIAQRFREQPGLGVRRIWDNRVDQIIPSSRHFTRPLFLAVFYPEAVRLAALFCSPTWRPTAELALTSADHRTLMTSEINRTLGHQPRPLLDTTSYEMTTWIYSMVNTPNAEPKKTFLTTRRITLDGNPVHHPGRTDLNQQGKAHREFAKHRHTPAWTLPTNTRRIVTHYQSPSDVGDRSEPPALMDLLGHHTRHLPKFGQLDSEDHS